METSFTCKDGSRRYVRFSFASTGSKNIVTCENLTIRIYMETALRESKGCYRGILMRSMTLSLLLKLTGVIFDQPLFRTHDEMACGPGS